MRATLWTVMLTKPGAEALLLWLLSQGYEVKPAGNTDTVLRTDGNCPVIQADVRNDRALSGRAIIDAITGFFEEKKIGYLFLLLMEDTLGGTVLWEVEKARALPPTPPDPSPPNQWDPLAQGLKEDEG